MSYRYETLHIPDSRYRLAIVSHSKQQCLNSVSTQIVLENFKRFLIFERETTRYRVIQIRSQLNVIDI